MPEKFTELVLGKLNDGEETIESLKEKLEWNVAPIPTVLEIKSGIREVLAILEQQQSN